MTIHDEPKDINELDLKDLDGVGPTISKKLKDAGIISIVDLAVCSTSELCDRINSTPPTAKKIIDTARDYLREHNFLQARIMRASEFRDERASMPRLTTGTTELDDLLKGGIELTALTEVYGEFGSSKTQLCFTLAVMATQPLDKKGLDAEVLFFDCENTYRQERIIQIAKARELDPNTVLNRIIYVNLFNTSELEYTIQNLGHLLKQYKVKLIIVDGIMSQFRAEVQGRGELSGRQQRLARMLDRLKKFAELEKLAVVITNQVQSSPDINFGDPIKPTGGNIMAHSTTYRLYFKKSTKNIRIAKIMDSSYHEPLEARFQINEKGIDDIEK